MNAPKEHITLDLLKAIENNDKISQRKLAGETGIALGLVNSYIKMCARKGFIKIREIPANRYLYYLTPRGFAEKSRLTANYLASSLDFYRSASTSCSEIIREAQTTGWDRVVFWGRSELAEIALIRAQEAGVRVVAIVDSDVKPFIGVPVWHDLSRSDDFDFCLITDLGNPDKAYRRASEQIEYSRILAPDVLELNTD